MVIIKMTLAPYLEDPRNQVKEKVTRAVSLKMFVNRHRFLSICWWTWVESNHRPSFVEKAALPGAFRTPPGAGRTWYSDALSYRPTTSFSLQPTHGSHKLVVPKETIEAVDIADLEGTLLVVAFLLIR